MSNDTDDKLTNAAIALAALLVRTRNLKKGKHRYTFSFEVIGRSPDDTTLADIRLQEADGNTTH